MRTANRGAKATERALLAGIRPLLVPSRMDDAQQKVGFADNHWVKVGGGRGVAEATDEAVYLAIALRNVGNGLAVLDRWDLHGERPSGDSGRPDPAGFRRLTRDLYLAPGDLGFWQGTYRDRDDRDFQVAHDAITQRRAITVDVLYGDHEGGQRTISRFTLIPTDGGDWVASVSRHWNLDRADPR